jgi:hypothetical protein
MPVKPKWYIDKQTSFRLDWLPDRQASDMLASAFAGFWGMLTVGALVSTVGHCPQNPSLLSSLFMSLAGIALVSAGCFFVSLGRFPVMTVIGMAMVRGFLAFLVVLTSFGLLFGATTSSSMLEPFILVNSGSMLLRLGRSSGYLTPLLLTFIPWLAALMITFIGNRDFLFNSMASYPIKQARIVVLSGISLFAWPVGLVLFGRHASFLYLALTGSSGITMALFHAGLRPLRDKLATARLGPFESLLTRLFRESEDSFFMRAWRQITRFSFICLASLTVLSLLFISSLFLT